MVLKDGMNKKDFLSFVNYVDRKFENEDWITVARSEDINADKEHEFTLSRLIENKPEIIKKILSRFEWEVHQEFGIPEFSGWGEVHYETNNVTVWQGIQIESFTIIRYFDDPVPPQLELVQNFILYHNLLFIPKQNHYIEQKSSDVVIEIIPNQIRIRSRYLRDYLAARDMVLVRYHDHRRRVNDLVVNIIGKKREKINKKTNSRHYAIVIAQHDFPNILTYSRLLGKDIIRPFDEPLHPNYLSLKGVEKKSESFIVGRENGGKLIEKSCKQNDPLEFLRIVSFKKDVLKKYYDNTSKYTVDRSTISCGHWWGIPYWIKNDRVHVHLGDLYTIPHDEQIYWKSFNVEFQESTSKTELDEMLENEFCGEDPVHELLQLYKDLNKRFETQYGFKLFKELSGENKHVISSLHSLTSNEQKELEEQMIAMSKIFVESLDKKELSKLLKWQPKNEDEKRKSILYLENFLIEKLSLDPSNAKMIINSFRIVQSLRSEFSAHLTSSKYEKMLERLGLSGLTIIESSNTVILQLYRTLHRIFFKI